MPSATALKEALASDPPERNRHDIIRSMLAYAPQTASTKPAAATLDRLAPPFGRSCDGTLTARREAWMYTMLPLEPLVWADAGRRRGHALRLQAMLAGLAAGRAREFHLLWLAWDEPAAVPTDAHPRVREWLDPVFSEFLSGFGLFAAGVKLHTTPPGGLLGRVCGRRAAHLGADREHVQQIFTCAGGQPLSDTGISRMESWWNGGAGRGDELDVDSDDKIVICDAFPEGIAFSAATGFDNFEADPQRGGWLADAAASEGCVAVSARGVMKPAQYSSDVYELGQASKPLLRDCSVVFAHRASPDPAPHLYALEQLWGVTCRQLCDDKRLEALAETLPLGRPRVAAAAAAPSQLITASGIGAYNDIGERSGVWIGTAVPSYTPVWLDPAAASQRFSPPIMGVFGEPGSGKTTLLQLIAEQAALSGLPVVYINPNAADSLTGFADSVNGDTVKLSELTQTPGTLDPFRYAAPDHAAALAICHIETALPTLTDKERVALTVGIRQAATDGARCVGEAITHQDVPSHLAALIRLLAKSDELFGLGVSQQPQDPWSFTTPGRLTLVEFDRCVALPVAGRDLATLDAAERSASAALRLVAGAALEQIIAAGDGLGPRDGPGGVLIVDEAFHVLSGGGARSILDRIRRTGPNHAILPIMATQTPAALIDEPPAPGLWMGRGLALAMTDPLQTDAALSLCRMEPTDDRSSFLRDAGPLFDRRSHMQDRGALGLYRDLDGGVSALLVGPLPEHIRRQYCTDPSR